MKLGRLTASVAAAAICTIGIAPSSFADDLNSQDTVWIYGQSTTGSSAFCFSKAETRKAQRLQLRSGNGDWHTVATSKPKWFTKAGSCRDQFRKYPYNLNWRFVVSELGDRVEGDEYRVQARELTSDGSSDVFTKTVYPSKAAHAQALADAFRELLGGS